MDKTQIEPVQLDAWQQLKQFTDARIALGRAGCSIPTRANLEFQYAHAQAKDAVHQQLDLQQLSKQLKNYPHVHVHSQAVDKATYLKRPDLGRLLDQSSIQQLQQVTRADAHDVLIVIGDGLSARAIEANAVALVEHLIEACQTQGWSVAPLVIASHARVALGDQVAEILNVPMLVMLIGERPGLSSPDSMGIYYTWQAKIGSLDAQRNCISNVRSAGLSVPMATQRLMALMRESKRQGISGVALKDQHRNEEVSIDTSSKKLLF